VRAKLLAQLTERRERMRKEGRYPYEARWLTQEEIIHFQGQLKKSDHTIFFELMLLFVFMGGLIYGLYKLMLTFLLPG